MHVSYIWMEVTVDVLVELVGKLLDVSHPFIWVHDLVTKDVSTRGVG